ncbi:MAG TPA: hypothetical protein VFY05_00990, partial [Candidatus Angelobacter sp.]|nr:hypothetical protein [Candidatus Angelobacter sp.]
VHICWTNTANQVLCEYNITSHCTEATTPPDWNPKTLTDWPDPPPRWDSWAICKNSRDRMEV